LIFNKKVKFISCNVAIH